jgi:aspartate ammonia-lyase
MLWRSPGLITAFVPKLGYEAATRLAKEFQGRGGDCHAFLLEKLGAEAVADTLSPENLTALGHRHPDGASRI